MMKPIVTKIDFQKPRFYNLHMVCHTHGWKNLAPFFWDDVSNSINFAVRIDTQSIDISARQKSNKIEVSVTSHSKLNSKNLNYTKGLIRRSLSIDANISGLYQKAKEIGKQYEKLIRKGAGRLLRAPTLWEDAAKTLFTTNCSWSLTEKICETICSEKFIPASPSGAFPFPSPDVINGYSSNELKKLIPVGYRNRFLKSLAEAFSNDSDLQHIESDEMDYFTAKKIASQLKGFGSYASSHILLLSGYFQDVPIDTVVVSYLKRVHRVRKPSSFIDRHYRKWGEYKWWGLKFEKMLNRQNWLGDVKNKK